MPTFNPQSQAAEVVRAHLHLGETKPTNRAERSGSIYSVGTARSYKQSLKQAATWLRQNHRTRLQDMTREQAREYLEKRAHEVRDLSQDRNALLLLPHVDDLDRVRTQINTPGRLSEEPRAYTPEQVDMVRERQSHDPQRAELLRQDPSRQSQDHAFSTRLAEEGGLRAHELFTIRRYDERPPTTARDWNPERWEGREDWPRYTVEGKGGLVREARFSPATAEALETRRLDAPRRVTDREVHYEQHYDVSGGLRWSRSFSAASQRALGWSNGGHGLRHSYAQDRLEYHLDEGGKDFAKAEALTSQEQGHFRVRVTREYLR